MEDQEFESLAMRVLRGEASAAEAELLEAVVANDDAKRLEFRELKQTLEIVRGMASLSDALKATAPELPAYRMNELRAAVRAEFPERRRIFQGALGARMRGLFIPRRAWAWGGSAALAVLVCILIFHPGKGEIEFAVHEEFATRGAANFPSVTQESHLKKVVFQRDEDFEAWRKKPLSRRVMARIWIDEENDAIHILRRDTDGCVREFTETLALGTEQRENQLKRIVDSLR